jgi:hypothetical protein
MEDWIGNNNSIWKTLGASNHTDKQREQNDYYATEPKALELLLELEEFSPYVWECACGEGHLSKVLEEYGYKVISSDIVDRGYGQGNVDFLQWEDKFDGDIITNPPYKYAKEFIEKALELIPDGHKVAMFLKVQFLEGKARRELFEKNPPKMIWISSSRLLCAKNGEFQRMRDGGGSAVAYAWFIWKKGYKGRTNIGWFN